MAGGAQLRTSHPAMDSWRPQAERLSYADAAWLGAAWGIAAHATLHFFSVALPVLERLLVLFAPVENFVFTVAAGAAPIGRWMLLLVSLAVFWGLIATATLGVWREVEAVVTGRQRAAKPEPMPSGDRVPGVG